MASTALTKARSALESARKTASTLRSRERERQSPMGVLSQEAPGVLAGGAAAGALEGITGGTIMGLPAGLVGTIATAGIAVGSGSSFAARAALGMAAYEAGKRARTMTIGLYDRVQGETSGDAAA